MPCGHFVCQRHILSCTLAYSCPYAPGCRVHSCIQVHRPDQMPQVSKVVSALLEIGAPSIIPSRRRYPRYLVVREANTPQRLAAYYDMMAEDQGRQGRFAEAAVAFSAAAYIRESFLATSLLWASGVGGQIISSKSAAAAAIVHQQHVAWLRANAWAKMCNSQELHDALVALPVPTVTRHKDVQQYATRLLAGLRANTAKVRQVSECPVCLRLLLQPVTTRCGHTFCKECLGRALELSSGCPLCRQQVVQSAAPCASLEAVFQEQLKEEYSQRWCDAKAETVAAFEELLLQVRSMCSSAQRAPLASQQGELSQMECLDAFPKANDDDSCNAIALAVLAKLPIPLVLKFYCLSRTCQADRITSVACVVRDFVEFMDNISAPNMA